jgi:Tfp pilus assembly protein PilF
LLDAGRLAEAEVAIKSALASKPEKLDYNLGMAALFHAKGGSTGAETFYRSAIARHPNAALAYKSYGDFLMLANRVADAEPRYAEAVRLKPTDAAYRKDYANSLQRNGKTSLAVDQLEEAFKLAPPSTQDLLDLSEYYAHLNQTPRVLDCYNRALAIEPDSGPALNNCAWLLATSPDDGIRNGSRAVELAERACLLTQWKSAVLMGTLAAAYAEAGRFPDAVAMARKAIAKAYNDKQEGVAKRNAELLELYRTGKSFREN